MEYGKQGQGHNDIALGHWKSAGWVSLTSASTQWTTTFLSGSGGKMVNEVSRYKGCLLGLACGDAVGTTVEFSPRGTFSPVEDMVGGGPFDLEPGQWTDDTSMALCLATSLVHKDGFDATDQMNRYCNWRSVGYLSCNGRCFDIGMTVAAALDRYLLSGNPFAGDPSPRSAGNGALMRLAPISMFYSSSAADTWHFAGESTRTTHGAQEAIECSRVFGLAVRNALLGVNKSDLLRFEVPEPLTAKVEDLVKGEFLTKQRGDVNGTGYCVDSLEAALWSFYSTDSFEQAILVAVNLGDDADTTAAICGQLAGAYYGIDAIPVAWLQKLTARDEIEALAQQLYECSLR